MENDRVIIIGAGITGIGAALRLEEMKIPYLIIEKEKRAGGLCRTESKNGFLFDYTGHLLHFKSEEFKRIILKILDGNIENRERNAWIYSNNVYTKYPYQMNLYRLPDHVITECLVKYCNAIFTLKQEEPKTYEDWINQNFGEGIGKHFFIPYTQKMLKMHPKQLLPETGGRFVPKANLEGMIKGAISDQEKYSKGYNAQFLYPSFGGIEQIITGLTKKLSIDMNEKVISIDINRKIVKTNKNRDLNFKYIISTEPLPELVQSLQSVPNEIKNFGKKLNWISVYNINIGINKKVNRKHWIYFPEEEFCFYRIGFPHNFSKNVTPKGCGSIYLELSYKSTSINKNAYFQKSVDNLIRLKVIQSEKDIIEDNNIDIPYAYVIYERDTIKNVCKINGFLEHNNIYTAGRFGGWNYFSMEDSFIDGKHASDKVIDRINNLN
jgi:protoporphyrinogen oxidase